MFEDERMKKLEERVDKLENEIKSINQEKENAKKMKTDKEYKDNIYKMMKGA